MKKILFINSCIRDKDSRTLVLAKEFISLVKDRYEVEEINIDTLDMEPKSIKDFQSDYVDPKYIELAKKVANADKLVIATPFWDMSFPSKLKIFIERTTLPGITMSETNDIEGVCKAEELLVINTKGWDIEDFSEMDGLSTYFRALKHLWGIKKYSVISVSGCDTHPDSVDYLIEQGLKKVRKYAKKF